MGRWQLSEKWLCDSVDELYSSSYTLILIRYRYWKKFYRHYWYTDISLSSLSGMFRAVLQLWEHNIVVMATVSLQPYTRVCKQAVAVTKMCSFAQNSKWRGGARCGVLPAPNFLNRIRGKNLDRTNSYGSRTFKLCYFSPEIPKRGVTFLKCCCYGWEFFFFKFPKWRSRRDAHLHFSSPRSAANTTSKVELPFLNFKWLKWSDCRPCVWRAESSRSRNVLPNQETNWKAP